MGLNEYTILISNYKNQKTENINVVKIKHKKNPKEYNAHALPYLKYI